ncbi:hypothetical protein ACQJBY_059917 [Aegilops geniculata]
MSRRTRPLSYVRPYPPRLLQGPDARFLSGAWAIKKRVSIVRNRKKRITEGGGVDGEEKETEAGVLAVLGWFQDREGKDSCLWRGKSGGFGRRSNQRSRRTWPLSCILATSPMLL